MRHVPYRGSALALNDLLGGHVDVMFELVINSLEHIKNGSLRALAVTTSDRSRVLPDLPPLADTFGGYEASATFGVGVARSTPSEIIRRLNKEINDVLGHASIVSKLAELGSVPLITTPDAYGDIIANETEKWGEIVRFSGAKVE